MIKEQQIYLWHDCLDCKDMHDEHCPLKGKDELYKIKDRISKPNDFSCLRFMKKSEKGGY